DPPPPPEPAQPPTKPKSVPTAWVLVAIVFLVAFVVTQARNLWAEWKHLQSDMDVVRKTAVIGYPNIHPNPSYARRPRDWFHDEGELTLLWSGWDGHDHRWFKFARGDVDRRLISNPMGRDVVQAIDYPMI